MQSVIKRYYNINKYFMSIIGGWPTQNIFTKIFMPILIIFCFFSIGFLENYSRQCSTHRLFTFCLTQFIKVSETWKTITKNCECLIILILSIGGPMKLFSIILNTKNVKQLLSLIDYHWHIFIHSTEISVMHDYAAIGKKVTLYVTVLFYVLTSFFMLIPIMPQLLDIIIPLNESRPRQYLFDVDYSFDRDVYYYVVLIHSYIISVGAISMLIAVDTFYISCSQHVCSLFAAVGQRLENLNLEISSWKNSELQETHKSGVYCIQCERDEKIYHELIVILWKHQLSIEYVNLLNSSFDSYSFMLLFLNMTVISLVGIQILALMNHKEEMIRFIAVGIGAFIHLFVLSYPGQRIIDHSSDIFNKTYNVLWYKLSRKSTQLLSVLLYRCLVPCKLTAGKMFVLSLINYASMVQTSVSYFTALSSLS